MAAKPFLAASVGLSLLAGCGPGVSEDGRAPADNAAEPPAGPVAPAAEPPAANQAEAAPPAEVPGVADMSPFQRRAFDQGYRDCSEGRYEPDPWPEAYRIGCGAAQEERVPEG